MSPQCAVAIEVDAIGRGTILVEGLDVSRLTRGVHLYSEAGQLTALTLDLAPSAVRAQLSALVKVDDETHDLLVSLGWTPPGSGA